MKNDQTIKVEGYQCFRNNRKEINDRARRGSGGVACLIRDTVLTNVDVTILDDTQEDILWIKIKDKNSQMCLCLCVCYLPPTSSSRKTCSLTFFSRLMESVYKYQNEGITVICGDMNSRIGENSDYIEGVDKVPPRVCIDTTENGYGQDFIDFCIDCNMCVLNGRFGSSDDFTCISTRGRSVVDYIVLPHEHLPLVSDFKVHRVSRIISDCGIPCPDTMPDHSLLDCSINFFASIPIAENVQSSADVRRTKYRVDDFPDTFLRTEQYLQQIQGTISRIEALISEERNLNAACDEFGQMLRAEMDKYNLKCSTRRSNNPTHKSKRKPYWNTMLQEQWDKTCQKEREWLKSEGAQNVRNRLKQSFCTERREFNRLLRKVKRQHQKRQQDDILNRLDSNDSRDFWRYIGKIGIANDRQTSIPMEVIDDAGNLHTNLSEVMSEWKGQFDKLYNDDGSTDDYDEAHLQDIRYRLSNTDFASSPEAEALNRPIDRHEIVKAVERAKLRKAAGIDAIPAEALKNDVCVDLLHRIISECFTNGVVPNQWKTGIINPIVKPNSTDVRRPSTYRGITLLSVPSKIYCDILNHRLVTFLDSTESIADEQNGFRRRRGCQEHIYSLYSIINNRKNAKLSTFACFIDLRKAFDTVNRHCLWFKLRRLGIEGKFYDAICSLYDDIKCCVQINGMLTDTFRVQRGVKQGCLISPTLFSVYINDLADDLKSANLGVNVNETIINLLMYADDVVLLTDAADKLQRMLNIVHSWCRKWRLTVNGGKTKIVHFRPTDIPRSDIAFSIGDINIGYCDKYKYLGLWFTEHLDLNVTVRELTKAANRALGCLTAKYMHLGGMPYSVYCKLYETLVEPILYYCAGIWGQKEYRLVNNVQNRAMRLFLGVTKTTSNVAKLGDMGWTPCIFKQHIEVFRLRLKLAGVSDDRLLHKIHSWSRRLGRSWERMTDRLASRYDVSDVMRAAAGATPSVIRSLKHALFRYHEEKWFIELWNDRRSDNGNKLRTYRKYKKDLRPETYVTCYIPRHYRNVLAKFRCGSLPLHIETGRFNNTPLNERTCPFDDCIEDEQHFLIDCSFYDDLRHELINHMQNLLPDFHQFNSCDKLCSIMTCDEAQYLLSKTLFLMYRRRKFNI